LNANGTNVQPSDELHLTQPDAGPQDAGPEQDASGGAGGMGGGTSSGGVGNGGDNTPDAGSGGGAACGDGMVSPASGEQCDDGNTANNDGCTAECKIELSGNCPTTALVLGDTPQEISGDTHGGLANAFGSCGGASAKNYILKIQPAISGTLQATMDAEYNAVLWLRAGCPAGVPLGCDNSSPFALSSPLEAGRAVFLGIDGIGSKEGAFTLTLSIVP
jgi:cysteine-rich repeat protein